MHDFNYIIRLLVRQKGSTRNLSLWNAEEDVVVLKLNWCSVSQRKYTEVIIKPHMNAKWNQIKCDGNLSKNTIGFDWWVVVSSQSELSSSRWHECRSQRAGLYLREVNNFLHFALEGCIIIFGYIPEALSAWADYGFRVNYISSER